MEKRTLNKGMRVERKGEAESFVKKSICQGLFAQMKDQAQIQNTKYVAEYCTGWAYHTSYRYSVRSL